eukprot:913415_1
MQVNNVDPISCYNVKSIEIHKPYIPKLIINTNIFILHTVTLWCHTILIIQLQVPQFFNSEHCTVSSICTALSTLKRRSRDTNMGQLLLRASSTLSKRSGWLALLSTNAPNWLRPPSDREMFTGIVRDSTSKDV